MAWDGKLEEVDRLIEADGQLLNARCSEGRRGGPRYTPLMVAARLSQEPVAKRLLALGANVKLQGRDGDTALHCACLAHEAGIAALLLDAGADINAQNREGDTPLIVAAGRGSLACVQLLLTRGGDAIDLDVHWSRRSALHCAVIGDQMEILRLLLHSGANPHYIDFCLGTARFMSQGVYVDLLEAAMDEPKRPRILLKARTLLDAGKAVEKARSDAGTQAAVAAAPVYLKGRVGEGGQLPRWRWERRRRNVGRRGSGSCCRWRAGRPTGTSSRRRR